jgi:hypothetical protein
MLITPAQSCAQIMLTAHLSSPFHQLTSSKALSHICSATEQIGAVAPPCGRPSPPGHAVVNGWRRDERPRDIPQSHLRPLVSSAKPTTAVQVVWPAAPQCLDSLPPDAHRAGPLPPGPAGMLRALCQPCCVRWPTTPSPVKRPSRCIPPYMLLFSQTLSTKGQQGKSLRDTHCRGKTSSSTRLDR